MCLVLKYTYYIQTNEIIDILKLIKTQTHVKNNSQNRIHVQKSLKIKTTTNISHLFTPYKPQYKHQRETSVDLKIIMLYEQITKENLRYLKIDMKFSIYSYSKNEIARIEKNVQLQCMETVLNNIVY